MLGCRYTLLLVTNVKPLYDAYTTYLPIKATSRQWLDTWARDMVMGYWSVAILFWQVSFDHIVNVQCKRWLVKVDLFTYLLFIYWIAFTMITMLKRIRGKKHIWTRSPPRNEGRRCATHNRARLQIKCAPTENTQILTMLTLNIKHYKKYKNPIFKNDKNESLPQPIKSLSSSTYQVIEDYVTNWICSRSTSRC